MTTEGIEAVFITTHNWGKSAKFFQKAKRFWEDVTSGEARV